MKTKSFTSSAFINSRALTGFVFCLAALSLGSFAFIASATPPTVITVNSLSDTSAVGDGLCSLREAINNANANSDTTAGDCVVGTGEDLITFSVSGTITLGSTLPAIDDYLTIDGQAQSVTVSGNNSVRVMVVNSGKTLTLRNLTIANGLGVSVGYCSGINCSGGGVLNTGGAVNVINSAFSGNEAIDSGGAIYNDSGGTVNVRNCTFSDNAADISGGIFNAGTLNVTNSTFSGNLAFILGGGIFSNGSLVVTNSTFSGNKVGTGGGTGYGGAIAAYGSVNVANSTFFDNSALQGYGGGVYSGGTVTVTNCTFSGNSSDVSGGGIANDGTINLRNTIIANSVSGGDCSNSSSLTADSHNLADDNTCNGATVATSAEINLQPLASNGGPTQTMALGQGSVAIDAGDETGCASAFVNELDQRGVSRPVDGDVDGFPVCDVGAYERVPQVVTVTVKANIAGPSFSVDGQTYTSAQTFTWLSGSTHLLSTTSPQSAGTDARYKWNSWSDNGAISHTVTPTKNKTYTANFTTQYFLTMTAESGGTVTPASTWKNSGAVVSITATPSGGHTFTGWSGTGTGSYTGANNPASITIGGPISETASFGP
jgi:CSLREA domain-containing protein